MAELQDPQPSQSQQKTAERDLFLLEAVNNIKPSLLQFRVGGDWEKVALELKTKHGYDASASKLKRRMSDLLKGFTLKVACGKAGPKDTRNGKELLLQRILARKRIEEKQGPPPKVAKPKLKLGTKKENDASQLQSEIKQLKAQVARMRKKEAEKKRKLEEMKTKMAAIVDEEKTKMAAIVDEEKIKMAAIVDEGETKMAAIVNEMKTKMAASVDEEKIKMAAIVAEAKTKMTAAVDEAMEWTEVYTEPSSSTDSKTDWTFLFS